MKEVRNIRDRLRKKLCSEKGASLSYALLLFLVAAAVGSVVLTAATSASGRLAGLAEADQRYYSVTSAAELLKERYDGQQVTVIQTKTWQTVTDYSFEGGASPGAKGVPEETISINGQLLSPSTEYRPDSLFADAAYRLYTADALTEYPIVKRFTLQPASGGSDELQALTVSGIARIQEDGSVTIDLSSPAGGTDGGASGRAGVYTLRVMFGADKRERTDTITQSGTPLTDEEGSGYRIESITTQTDTAAITWKFEGIRTVTGAV